MACKSARWGGVQHATELLVVRHRGAVVNLEDVGVGVPGSAAGGGGRTVCPTRPSSSLKNPKSSAPPLAQAKLAELLATVSAEPGVRIIVERIPEHLFHPEGSRP